MRLALAERLDWPRYGGAVLTLLITAAATRFSAERNAVEALFGWLFWSLVFFACWLLRPRLPRDAEGKPPEPVLNLIGGIALTGFLLKLAVASLLPALAFLLLASQAALLLLAERRQHLWLLLGAALAAVLFAAAESRSALFLPCAAAFSFAALGLLALDHAQAQRARAQARQLQPAGAASGSLAYAGLTLLLALPLYLFLPKPAGLQLGGMGAQSDHDYSEGPGSGPATGGNGAALAASDDDDSEAPPEQDELDIRQVRRDKTLANDIVMFVDSSAPVNLRSALLDHFEQDRWRRGAITPQRRPLERGYYEQPGADARPPSVQQRIELVADLDERLPLAPGLRRLRFPAPVLEEYPDGSWSALRPLRAPTQYSVEAAPLLHQGRYLLPEPLPEPAAYLQLPEDLPPRIGELAQRVAGTGDALSQALALEDHLRRHYAYSFETVISSQGVTPLDEFLFETRRGHCEYFASALAIMLRSVGIPSRLAIGFSLGDRNPVTGYYEVRRLQGHAWVEAWLPQRGWLMLEPTPFYPLPLPAQDAQVAAETGRYLEQAARHAQALDPRSLKTALLGQLNDGWKQLRHLLRQTAAALEGLRYVWPLLLVLGLLLWPALQLLRLWQADRQGNREVQRLLAQAAAAAPPQRILATAEALQATLASRGAARPPGTPFAPYYEALLAADNGLPVEFGERFNAARYAAGDGAAAAEAHAALDAAIRARLAAQPHPRCQAQLDRWRRWAAGLPAALRRFRPGG